MTNNKATNLSFGFISSYIQRDFGSVGPKSPKDQGDKTQTQVTIDIHGLGASGEGIGTFDGLTIFAEGALPLEKVEVTITQLKKNYAKAKLDTIIAPSPNRVKPVCPLFGKCGGCQLMHLSYDGQLKIKRQKVLDALERIGHFNHPLVHDCVPSPSHLFYRNKIQLPLIITQNKIQAGLYARNSHEVIPIEKCYIHCQQGEEVLAQIQHLMNQENYTHVPLRHLLIKSTANKNESLVIFVTSKKSSDTLTKLAQQIMPICPSVKGVIENVNSREDNVILGSEFHLLCGTDHIEETLCGLTFNVSPASFFQVNPKQAELIYKKVVELAELDPTKTLLDPFCGVGTLTLIAAKACKEVCGIECVPQAIVDAKQNAARNQIRNCHFITGHAEKNIQILEKNWDVIYLNPPRKGCDPSLLKKICEHPPETIIYMSCDPATLARDLAILCQHEYQLGDVYPFDMFPQTSHVECVVKLVRK